jgi:hypothetical protein
MRQRLFLAFALACASSCHAPAPRHAASAVAARLEADVAWLAADAREGRRAGTQAGLESADWIAARFVELGLEPAGSQGWFFDFSVPLPAADGGESYLAAASTRIDAGSDLAPLYCSEGGSFRGETVFCGYGIESEALSRNDFEGLELAGRIALILRGTPPDLEAQPAVQPQADAKAHGGGAEPLFAASSVFTKVMNAKRRGAKACVLLTSAQGPALPAFDAASGARAGIPALALSESATARLFPVLESAAPAPMTLELRADVRRGEGPARNVLGRLRARDSSRALVIGAHYDHLGHGGDGSLAPDKTGEIHNGADDNASGTAVVLEVARQLREGPAPDCDVVFALWSGEELGLIGSERWAASPEFAKQRIVANLNLDMVGRADSGQLQVLGAGTGDRFAALLEGLAPESGLKLSISTQGGAMGGSSDHQSFLKRKVPALHLFTGLHADYHKPSDDIERFEAEGASKVAALSVRLARELCAPQPIAFVQPAVAPGRERGEGGFRAWFGSVPNYTHSDPGVLLDGTSKGSPAERAGFLAGDVLRQIGDVELSTVSDMVYALQRYKPGDVVLVQFQRDGKPHEVRVTLASRGAVVQ